MSEISIEEARVHLAKVLRGVARGETIYLTDAHGHRVAAIMPVAVAAALHAAEDEADARAAHTAMDEPGDDVDLEAVLAELGL